MDVSVEQAAKGRPGEAGYEIARRRTFAIISHPDAGKTTLTEKLLLFGGAIQLAGQVKAKGDRRRARSDWMRIEQDRGISVATSVMTFEHGGIVHNLLDTPGHEDFSEDTYRTLTAVDAAVMVIDAAKGIEEQTRKLFEVCRLRDIPILTFINKMDREARDPFELLDEIEKTLALDVTPATWPIGSGKDFVGTYDFARKRVAFLDGADDLDVSGPDDPKLDAIVPAPVLEAFRESAELAAGATQAFDLDSFRGGHMTPVYFGSALKNFGVRDLLAGIAGHAPAPGERIADTRPVEPPEPALTGFIFKIQANLDPNHRDRVAFLRICSGKLDRGMRLTQVRTGKTMAIHSPMFFFARDRAVVEEAWPGDVVGIANHGLLRIGDTLTEGETLNFTGVPSFAPEFLRRIRITDAMAMKKVRRALEELADEGVVQLFQPLDGAPWIVGVVGALQLDVLESRMKAEYNVTVGFETTQFQLLRWITADDKAALQRFREGNASALAEDHDGALVYFATSSWNLGYAEKTWTDIKFHTIREQHGVAKKDAA